MGTECLAFTYNSSDGTCFVWNDGSGTVPTMLTELPWAGQYLGMGPDAGCYVRSTAPPACIHTFADRATLKTAVMEYDSNAAAAIAKYAGPIAGWCVSLVTDMQDMFKDLHNFNADISGWDTSGVTSMYRMFWVCSFPRPVPICSAHSRVALSPLHKLRAPRSPASSPVSWHAHSSLRTVHALLATLDSTRRASTSL